MQLVKSLPSSENPEGWVVCGFANDSEEIECCHAKVGSACFIKRRASLSVNRSVPPCVIWRKNNNVYSEKNLRSCVQKSQDLALFSLIGEVKPLKKKSV